MMKKLVSLFCALVALGFIISLFNPGGSKNDETTKTESDTNSNKEAAAMAETDAAQEQLNKLIGMPFTDAKLQIESMGYSVSYIDEAMKDVIEALPEENKKEWEITEVGDIDADSKTLPIGVTASSVVATNKAIEEQRNALKEKLDATAAWIAAEKYGEQEYPYGFELKYILGKIAEDPLDENTWSLKAECKVTNEFNASLKMTCEAYVTGTTENPEITKFEVY